MSISRGTKYRKIVGSQTHEMSPGINALAVHDVDLRTYVSFTSPTNNFESILRLDSPHASARLFLEGRGSPGEIYFSIGRSLTMRNYRREARAIHSRKASDIMGSSELPTVCTACSAFGHPSQPGNSNTQNSPLDGASAAVISNRHLTRVGWTEVARSA